MGTLLPLATQTPWWGSQTASTYPTCGFSKKNCLGLQQFLSPTQSLPVFAAWNCGDLSSWHWNPGLGVLVWGWDSSHLRYPSQFFIHHMWVWEQPIPTCAPPTSLDGCGFFNSIVVKLLCNLISDDTECWLYNLVLILMWLCKEASRVYLCCHLGVYLFKQLSTKINTILNC